ncbi:MAG: PEP-CTERM sorting domain-containing protein [Candidatus Polarisedimenticolaceae bacterium]|nr:PEP-CTERM sorting domain-containing protein [Candidatus Polarisedimenticolaceae bacterium]
MKKFLSLALGVTTLFLGSVSHAAIIQVDYIGSVTHLGEWLAGDAVSIGDTVTGSFVYDLDLSPSDTLLGFTMSMGSSFNASLAGDSAWFRVYDDAGSNTYDAFNVGTTATSDALNGYTASTMQFGVGRYSSQGQLWDDALLPDLSDWANVTVADINRFDWRWMDFGVSGSGDHHSVDQIRWGVDSFSVADVSSVPEPSALVLMGIGLAGIGYRRRQIA